MKEMTTNDMGYTANNLENEETGETIPEQLRQAIKHFTNASVADRSAFEQLTK